MPVISVIIPVRNVEKYIDRCIESVLNQTFSDIEVMLMVGKCKDNSLEKCIEWQRKDDRIIIVSRNDTSLGDARNYALNIAKGEYVAYIDSDDYIEPTYIEKMVMPLIDDCTIDMSCCGYNTIDENQSVKEFIHGGCGIEDCNFDSFITKVIFHQVWLKICRKKMLVENQIEMYDGMAEDVAVFYMLAAYVKRIYFIREPLYHYNIENDQRLSVTKPTKGMIDHCRASVMAFEYLKKRNLFEENKKRCGIKFLNDACYMLNWVDYDINVLEEIKSVFQKYFIEVMEVYKKTDKTIKKQIIMFGVGDVAEKTFVDDKVSTENIKYIVDNSKEKQGKVFYGFPVMPAENLKYENNATIVITNDRYFYEISQQLMDMGIYNFMHISEYKMLTGK